MERIVRGDILVVEFPFSNLNEIKRRPVLVLKVPKGEDAMVIQITGSSYNKKFEIPISENDFEYGNLNRTSFVRIDKIASIEKSLIKYKIGRLRQKKFEEILSKIIEFIKN